MLLRSNSKRKATAHAQKLVLIGFGCIFAYQFFFFVCPSTVAIPLEKNPPRCSQPIPIVHLTNNNNNNPDENPGQRVDPSLLPLSPVVDISNDLSHCVVSVSAPHIHVDDFHTSVLLPRMRGEMDALDVTTFVCTAQCQASEPELDFSLRYLGGDTKYGAQSLSNLCAKGRAPLLVRVFPAVGHHDDHEPQQQRRRVQWARCPTPEGKLKASHQWFSVQRSLLVLSRLVEFAPERGVLFAFDNSDFSRPEAGDPHGLHWMYTEPAIVRFVGDASFPAMLWPTSPYIKQTSYCDFDEDIPDFLGNQDGGCLNNHAFPAWETLQDVVFWRGSPTGFPLDDDHVQFMPRSKLNKQFANRPGYDVAFAKDAVPPYANRNFMASHLWLPRVSRGTFQKHKMVLSLDGHTASWGLIERLGTGNVLLVVDSPRFYREFYYKLLVPFQHYLPIALDFSNLEAVRKWTLENPQPAKQIAKEAFQLVRTRMRPQDLWCYLFRLLQTLSSKMDFDVNDPVFDQFSWVDITDLSVQSYKVSTGKQ